MTSGAGDGLVTVEILGLPLRLYRQASEHSDGLLRELTLISRSDTGDDSVPIRLRRLIDELRAGFGAFTAAPTAALADALARGDERIDLVYRVPAHVKEAVPALAALLDEADAFCLAGEHLLTLATPPLPLAFRQWFLGEFVAQAHGAAPTSWDEFAARAGVAAGG